MTREDHEIELEQLKSMLESRRQLREATVNFEHAALKVAFLLNGGGLIAFLTFLGTNAAPGLVSKETTTASLVAWMMGLVLAGFASGFGYYSQYQFFKAIGAYQQSQGRLMEYPVKESPEALLKKFGEYSGRANTYRTLAVGCGLLSLVAFAAGATLAIIGYAL